MIYLDFYGVQILFTGLSVLKSSYKIVQNTDHIS